MRKKLVFIFSLSFCLGNKAFSFDWKTVYGKIQSGALEEAFFCPVSEESVVTLILSKNSSGVLYDEQGQSYPLKHKSEANSIIVEIPEKNLRQKSWSIEGGMGLIANINFPATSCYAVSHNLEYQFQTDVWIDCGVDPGSYIPGVGYSSNLFVLSRRRDWSNTSSPIVPGGSFRRKNTETPNNTISSFSFGIYLIKDKNVSIYFGNPKSRILFTGTFNHNYSKVLIKELGENNSGGQWCKVQS